MSEARGAKQMESANRIRAYQREWLDKTKERVKQGEPFVICHADECEEILNIMDIPVQVVNPWNAIIATKGMTQYYNNVLAQRGYDTSTGGGVLLIAGGLACTIDNKPEVAPRGGLPKPTVIIGSRGDVDLRILEIWAREFGCLYYPLQKSAAIQPHPPRWWEKLKDHWDELIESRSLDFRVEQLKALIHFLEAITGRTFSFAKLNRAMELINEQMDYWRKARDLIFQTIPCPVSVRDQLTTYQTMWHRGTTIGRDLIKAYYEEVKERVDKGIASNPNEKLRLMWEDGTPPAWAGYAEEKYGAVCVAPMYFSIAYEAYTRTVYNNDPLRALASRNLMLFASTPDWRLRDAKLCKCNGAVQVTGPSRQSQLKPTFEEAGIPFLTLPRDSDDPEIRSMLDDFIEKRLLT